MDVSAPHRAVVAGVDGDVLVLLAGRTTAMSTREIAHALSGRSFEGVRKSLDRLVGQGIVNRQAAGNALMHRLNHAHVGAAAVMALAGMRGELWDRLRTALAAWDPPALHASVFGSAARRDGTAASDIDLFLVRPRRISGDDPTWRDQVDTTIRRLQAWSGNSVSVVEQDEQELRDLLATAAPPRIIEELRRDGIDVAGVPIRKLLWR